MLRRFGKIGMVYQHEVSVAELKYGFSSYAAGENIGMSRDWKYTRTQKAAANFYTTIE